MTGFGGEPDLKDLTPEKQAQEPLISARGRSKSFGANRVLKGVSLDIKAGDILVLLGPNGAGKSTLLNIIGGTLKPSEGDLNLSMTPDATSMSAPRARSTRFWAS
jgi:ribose transport system ATP-binding protein